MAVTEREDIYNVNYITFHCVYILQEAQSSRPDQSSVMCRQSSATRATPRSFLPRRDYVDPCQLSYPWRWKRQFADSPARSYISTWSRPFASFSSFLLQSSSKFVPPQSSLPRTFTTVLLYMFANSYVLVYLNT